MHKINKMMVMLALMLSLGTQTASANGGVLVSDRHSNPHVKPVSLVDILVVYMKTGIIVDSREGIMLDD